VDSLRANPQTLVWEQARAIVLERVRSRIGAITTETVPLSDAHGRVVAVDVTADRDYPALDRSLRDGYAVRAADLPGSLAILGELRAGDSGAASLTPGHAIEIMTGAPLPSDADAVVMVEHTERVNGNVKIEQHAEPGQFINRRGSEARQGSVLVAAGTRLDVSHVAALASAGAANVPVFRKPSVAILSTGDELVDVSSRPAAHQIRNSNSVSLAALVAAAGGVPVIQPVANDNEKDLLEALKRGLEHDVLLISGGVSAGRYDLVKPCLRRLGAEFFFERVKIQPGQPTAFGFAQGKFVFGLPGNPGSSMITFQLFGRPALELLAGEREPQLDLYYAKFAAPFRHKGGLTRFLPASIDSNGNLRHIPWQGSSDIPALARANVFLIADYDRETWNTGDNIRVLLKP
jgi:molybdopterin molybdotransferase